MNTGKNELVSSDILYDYSPPKKQLLKWIGNKKKYAPQITKAFPRSFKRYFEPFLGSAAILATIAPKMGVGSDTFEPLIDIWRTLKENPKKLLSWYSDRRNLIGPYSKEEVYEIVKNNYNQKPNGADFLYLSRACYGGVIRFRKVDGFMSTPCGTHIPISTSSFEDRVEVWYGRVKNTLFLNCDYSHAFELARKGDLIYCDPPYSNSQSILYGAQDFNINELFENIKDAKSRGVMVALSIEGQNANKGKFTNLNIPLGIFEKEMSIELGYSMLKRFQMEGERMIDDSETDRLLLTY